MPMQVHQIAGCVSVLLLVPLAFIQVVMRRQVHDAHYGTGSKEVSPWDPKYVNAMFGKYGIWRFHKQAFARSGVRSAFVGLAVLWAVCVLVGILAFLVR